MEVIMETIEVLGRSDVFHYLEEDVHPHDI